MVAQPDREARREEALARLAAVTEAMTKLERALRDEPHLPDVTAQALIAGARALCPVAATTGAELAVSAGPDHRWTVFVRSDAAGPQLRVRRLRLDPPTGPTSALEAPAPDVAVQLADLLRTGSPTDDRQGAPR